MLTKAKIEILDAAAVDESRGLPASFEVQFNPTEYSLTKGAQIAEIAIPGIDSPILQFVAGQNEKLTLDLYFDTTLEKGMGDDAKNVTEYTRRIYQLVKIQPKTHAPPRIRFTWGHGLSFEAIAESVTQKFTLFNPDGVPLRATLSVTFREYKTLQKQLQELNLQSSDHTRRHVVVQGDTLDGIAAREYGDPSLWRVIADENSRQLDNPRRLRPGQELRLRALTDAQAVAGGRPDMSVAGPLPIYRDNDFYVPRFEVTIGNRRQAGDVVRDVMQVSYKDNVEEIDSFELTVNNWEAGTRRFKYSDKDLFNPGQEVELRMGYLGQGGGGLRTMLRGEITSLRPSFPASGQPTLAVSGLNVMHRFRKEQKSDRYEGLTASQIAARVCKRLPITFLPPDTPPAETPYPLLIQDNQYDIVFLMALAREAGCELVVSEDASGTAVKFGPPSTTARPTYRLTYGRSLTEFQPTLSVANQVSDVVVRGWDPVKGEPIEEKVGQGQLAGASGLEGKLKKGMKNPVKDRKEVVANRPVRDKQAARELARATLTRINDELVKASGSVVGVPDLRSGSYLHLDGLGLRFNGRYFVNATTHTLGTSGYVTQFECKLIELSHKSDGEAL